ncbi:MAG TPA: hypothetical protein VM901_12995 [Bdellovibrionota bacterium]|jgi:hypothetical protein|nr:hypothetical protein [Bdellovibrionota bacterium]
MSAVSSSFFKSATLLAMLWSAGAARAEGFSLAPKIFAKYSSGIISNVGTVTGSGFSFGGVYIGGLFFIMDQVALGGGYKVESDFSSIPLKGVDIIGRYYYMGPGTILRSQRSNGDSLLRHFQWAPYVGASFSNRSFNVENDSETAAETGETTVSGNISTFNLSLGVDYRVSTRWEFTAEGEYTLIPFGGSDPRVKIKWMMVNLGLNFLF